MKSKKKSSRKPSVFRRAVRTVKILLGLAALSTIYLYLPESLSQKVVQISPTLDRAIAATGYHPARFIDSLPVWGKEVRIPCSDPKWYALCSTAPDIKRTQRLDSTGFFVGDSEALRNPLRPRRTAGDLLHEQHHPADAGPFRSTYCFEKLVKSHPNVPFIIAHGRCNQRCGGMSRISHLPPSLISSVWLSSPS